MIRLGVLGSLTLTRSDGSSVGSVLAQPKRFALLTYLAASGHVAAHPRDSLLALLWPDLDQDRSRRALRQALYRLRVSLGPGVITGKGQELVGVDRGQLWCDAAAFSRALAEGRTREALELYRGPFLDGFHVSGAPEFERWADRRHREFRREAASAAWRLVEGAEEGGDTEAIRRWAERAVELAPYDGGVLRRYLELMDRLGQPAAAVRAYGAYAARLREELDLEPAEATRALVQAIRRGQDAGDRPAPSQGPAPDTPDAVPPAAESGAPDAAAPPDAAADSTTSDSPAGPPSPAPRPADAPAAHRPVPPKEARTNRRVRGLLGVGLPAVLLIGLLGYLGFSSPGDGTAPAAPTSIRSIAVLPFTDLGPEDQRWFGDGIAEEIVDALVKVEPLTVLGRSSSFGFRDGRSDVRAIGDSLGVGAVLRGSVRRAGDRVRITVQLVRSSDGSYLWSRSYDRALTSAELFRVQQEIARSVTDALQIELGLETPARPAAEAPASLEAYSLYLRARSGMRERNADGRRQARRLIDEALALDPEFARAWALSAALYVREPYWEARPDPGPEESRRLALEAARRAVSLDPALAEAHSTLGHVLDHERKWSEARSHHDRAIELNPRDPDPRGMFLWHLAALGEWERAVEEARIRQRLDPLYPPGNGNLAGMLMYAGRLEESLEAWRRAIARAEADDAHAHFLRSLYAKALALQGRMDRAVSMATSAYRTDGGPFEPRETYYLSQLAAMQALAGQSEAARSLLERLRARTDPNLGQPLQSLTALDHARVHAALGQVDSAFVWLERSDPDRWRSLEIARFRGDPWWAPIRDDPRYLEILDDLSGSETIPLQRPTATLAPVCTRHSPA